jgi:hypothetical protein
MHPLALRRQAVQEFITTRPGRVRTRLPAGGRWIRTCMGLLLSSSDFGL